MGSLGFLNRPSPFSPFSIHLRKQLHRLYVCSTATYTAFLPLPPQTIDFRLLPFKVRVELPFNIKARSYRWDLLTNHFLDRGDELIDYRIKLLLRYDLRDISELYLDLPSNFGPVRSFIGIS